MEIFSIIKIVKIILIHGNSNKNSGIHHLYVIRDRKYNSVFKYGISSEPLRNGCSLRAEKQVNLFNKIAEWNRFYAVIVKRNIKGRKQALLLEREYIHAFVMKNGTKPKGN